MRECVQITADAWERAKTFVYENGRLIDRCRYAYFFENGDANSVLTALKAYQNDDGGFGHALEPDIRCPHSQPVTTEMAMHIMDELGTFDREIVRGIIQYLEQTIGEEGGVPPVFQSVNDYPHAPWWTVKERPEPNINPTGAIIALLYKQNAYPEWNKQRWAERAVEYVWRYMAHHKPQEYHDGIHWLTFLAYVPDRKRAQSFQSKVDDWLSTSGVIERNPEADGYVHKVLDWAPAPGSLGAQYVSEEDIQRHLAQLIHEQEADGGWPISWPAISPACQLEWRAYVTIERLRTLHAYGAASLPMTT